MAKSNDRSYQHDASVINFSKISDYMRCPLKYYFAYIAKISTPKTSGLTFGSAFHAAVEHNYRQKITSRQDIKTKDIQDKFAAAFDDLGKATDFGEDKPAALLDHGVLCVGCYHDQKIATEYDCQAISPQVQPTMVEQTFTVEFENFEKPLMGSIDLITEGEIIRDTKTAASKPSPDSTFKSNQLTCYTLGHKILTGKMPAGVALDYVVKTKKPQIITLEDTRTQADIDMFLVTVGRVEWAIAHGLFYPNFSNMMCTPKGCGYWFGANCLGGRGKGAAI